MKSCKSEFSSIHIFSEMYLDVPLDEKRTMYKCGNKFTTLDKVDPWTTTLSRLEDSLKLNQSDFQKITGKCLVLVEIFCC